MHYGLLLSGFLVIIVSLLLFLYESLTDKNINNISMDMEHYIDEINTMSTILIDEIDKRQRNNFSAQEILRENTLSDSRGNENIDNLKEKNSGVEENNYNKILIDQYQKGYTLSQIAQRLNISVSEVEMIINLHNKKDA